MAEPTAHNGLDTGSNPVAVTKKNNLNFSLDNGLGNGYIVIISKGDTKMNKIVTQNGVVVTNAHHICVSHNDFYNKDKSNFGRFFVAIECAGAAAYDTQYDPILFMPRNTYLPGTEAHRRRNSELERMAHSIANFFRRNAE